jgi:dTDP-4-amino-4,6-dideoxygalactose transaminase
MKIPHSQPYFDDEDKKALSLVLDRKFVTNGPVAAKLGAAGARLLGQKWGMATQSGTSALTAALMILKLKKNRKVLVPAYICSAPLDAIHYSGLVPELEDIDKDTLALSVERANSRKGLQAVIGAHLFGIQAPFEEIENPRFIEDCAQTLGAKNKNGICAGSSGRLAIASFYGTKLMATGHGGLLTGGDPELLKEAERLFKHDNNDFWEPHLHGLMSDLDAALGISQMKKLNSFIRARRKLARRFANALGVRKISGGVYSRFLVAPVDAKGGADSLIMRFRKKGIEAKRPVYRPLCMSLGLDFRKFPNAMWAHENIVSIPLYPGMPEERVEIIESFLETRRNEISCWPSA